MDKRTSPAPLDRLARIFTVFQALGSLAWYLLTVPTLLDGLLKALTGVVALGNLMWFIWVFRPYFHGVNPAGTPAHPVHLAWVFVLLLSLVCAVVALRRAALRERADLMLKLSFLIILAICGGVAIFAHLVRGSLDGNPARHVSWVTWLLAGLASAGLMVYALRGTWKSSGTPSSQPPAP